MMRSSGTHLLVMLVACCALMSSAGARELLQKMATAGSSSTAVAMGGGMAESRTDAQSFGGEAFAEAFASSEVVEQASNIFVTVTNQILDKTEDDIGNCTLITAVAEAEVSAQAEAVAAVYVESFGTVTVDGEGMACANAASAGEASASAFADGTAKAIVDTLGDKAQAGSEAIVQAVAAGTASAFANAFADTCTTGGFGEAQQTAFGKAIVRPMVEVYALAIGGTSCEEEAIAATAEAVVDGESKVEDEATAGSQSTTTAQGDTTATTAGDAGATTDVADTAEEQNEIKSQSADKCSNPFTTCCTRLFRDKDECTCSLGSAQARCNAKKIFTDDNGKATWEDSDAGEICTCR